MVSDKTIDLFKIYANEYNKNPESKLSDKTYDDFYNNLINEHSEYHAMKISDTLCTITDDNKIDVLKNIEALKIGGNIR